MESVVGAHRVIHEDWGSQVLIKVSVFSLSRRNTMERD